MWCVFFVDHELLVSIKLLDIYKLSVPIIRRLFAISDDRGVVKPGMVRQLHSELTAAIELEIWELPMENVGHFVLQVDRLCLPRSCHIFPLTPLITWPCFVLPFQVPPPLGIGTVELEDGSNVKGFICEGWVVEAASCGDKKIVEITHLGGWLKFVEQQKSH